MFGTVFFWVYIYIYMLFCFSAFRSSHHLGGRRCALPPNRPPALTSGQQQQWKQQQEKEEEEEEQQQQWTTSTTDENEEGLIGERGKPMKNKKKTIAMENAKNVGKTRWSPRTRMPTRMLRNKDNTYWSHIPANPLVGHPDLTHWGDTLVGHPCLTLLRNTR